MFGGIERTLTEHGRAGRALRHSLLVSVTSQLPIHVHEEIQKSHDSLWFIYDISTL